jgi:hypothetical protein
MKKSAAPARSWFGCFVFDEEKSARSVGNDENGREQSVAKMRKTRGDHFVDQPEMQRPGESADRPGQRLAFFI